MHSALTFSNLVPDVFVKKLTTVTTETGKAIDAAIDASIPSKDDLTKAAGYTAATFEYIGFASMGAIKSCGTGLKHLLPSTGKMLDECHMGPKAIARACDKLCKENYKRLQKQFKELSILRRTSRSAADLERITAMEERLARIEDRLMQIEHHGIALQVDRGKLAPEKLGLLRQLVEINKELRGE
ncbi:MAG: hypothetical protein OEV28_06095 [Nitrospirota bacterium]|nr:hypothetical protein [Nitrospirota bacterium]